MELQHLFDFFSFNMTIQAFTIWLAKHILAGVRLLILQRVKDLIVRNMFHTLLYIMLSQVEK
jgi:hypothetical protein